MLALRFTVVAALSAALFVGGEVAFGYPGAAWFVGALGALAIAGTLVALIGSPHRTRRTLAYWSAPLALWAAAFFYALVAEGMFARHAAVGITAALIGVYFTNLVIAHYLPLKYEAFSFASVVQVVTLVTVYFISYDLFSLMVFVHLPSVVIPSALFGFVGLLTFQNLWSAEIPPARMLPHLFLTPLLAAELGIVLTLLPFSSQVLAAITTLGVYASSGLIREHARSRAISGLLARRYAVVAIGALALVLGTARWPY